MNGAELLVACLEAERVRHVVGIPGTTIMDVLDVLVDHPTIRYLSVRHEQVAAGVGDGVSRASGDVGVCIGSRGPGLTNMATAIATAHDESIPLVVIVGQVGHDVVGRGAFEELDVAAMFTTITKDVVEVPTASRIPELVQHAFRTATSGRPGPVVVALPLDVIQGSAEASPQPHYRPARPTADPRAVREAAALLAGSQRPAILVGGGVRSGDAQDVLDLAEDLGAPIVTSWLRKDRVPGSHPHVLGTLGAGAFDVTDRVVREADVLLALGCRFSEFTTKRWTLVQPETRIIHVDLDASELGHVYVPAVGIQADAAGCAASLHASLQELGLRRSEVRLERLAALRATYESLTPLTVEATQGSVSMSALTAGVAAALARRPITLVMDAPSTGTWIQRHVTVDRPRSYYASAGGAMGWGLPAAMGIVLARPDERVVCLSGDGSFWMVAQDFETCVRENLPVVNVVSNNFAYGNTRDRQRTAHGARYLGVFYDNPDLAAFARLHGGHGERVTAGEDVAAAILRAVDSGLPAIVDVVQDRYAGLPDDLAPLPTR